MKFRYRPLLAAFAALVATAACGQARAKGPGVSDSEIVFGQCAALTGKVADIGRGMSAGLKAAFEESNAEGGVFGRRLRLIAIDDAYDPERTVDCTEEMIERNGVFALTGYVGTPTAKVAVPIVQELKIPLVGVFSGAPFLSHPVQRYVVNVRASYDNETEALVEYLVASQKISKIGVFYQSDSFGLAGVSGVEHALARRHLTIASKGSFERGTLAVRSGLAHVMAGAPGAVVIVAPSEAAIAFCIEAAKAGLRARFAAISFIGTEKFIAGMGTQASGILISQVVPSPEAPLPVAERYRTAFAAAGPGFPVSYASFEGYITGRILLTALAAAGPQLTREKLIDALEGMTSFDAGGMTFSFSAANHQGSNAVYLTVIKDGRAVLIP